MTKEERDQLILERDKTVWIVTVETTLGTIEQMQDLILEDEEKENGQKKSSWETFSLTLKYEKAILLGLGISNANPKITGFRLRFRSHTEKLPDNADGYYFKKGVIADLNDSGNNTANCYVMGYVEGDKLHKIWYRVPELIEWFRETIPLDKSDPMLIMNHG